jgi:hypothetical protein
MEEAWYGLYSVNAADDISASCPNEVSLLITRLQVTILCHHSTKTILIATKKETDSKECDANGKRHIIL